MDTLAVFRTIRRHKLPSEAVEALRARGGQRRLPSPRWIARPRCSPRLPAAQSRRRSPTSALRPSHPRSPSTRTGPRARARVPGRDHPPATGADRATVADAVLLEVTRSSAPRSDDACRPGRGGPATRGAGGHPTCPCRSTAPCRSGPDGHPARPPGRGACPPRVRARRGAHVAVLRSVRVRRDGLRDDDERRHTMSVVNPGERQVASRDDPVAVDGGDRSGGTSPAGPATSRSSRSPRSRFARPRPPGGHARGP